MKENNLRFVFNGDASEIALSMGMEVGVSKLDWFNKSDADFGYVWPTRIARSKIDNRFYGQGIRMGNFILDPTGKQRIDAFGNEENGKAPT
ncbi:hypothetical protein ACX0G9_28760 [Flavitalea flava]